MKCSRLPCFSPSKVASPLASPKKSAVYPLFRQNDLLTKHDEFPTELQSTNGSFTQFTASASIALVSRCPTGFTGEHSLIDKSKFTGFAQLPDVVGFLDQRPERLREDRPQPAEFSDIQWMSPFIQYADNRTRRWPPIGNSNFRHFLNHLLTKPVAGNCSGNRIVKEHAGFALDETSHKIRFQVDGKTAFPLAKKSFYDATRLYEIYPVALGKVLIPQATLTDCSSATINMLLIDHGFLNIEDKPEKFVAPGNGNFPDQVEQVIFEKTGKEPVVFKKDLRINETKVFKELAAELKKHGTAILYIDGHYMMLDSIQKNRGKFVATIRDPFHGTQLDVKLTKELFIHDSSQKSFEEEAVGVFAIFLPYQNGSYPKAAKWEQKYNKWNR